MKTVIVYGHFARGFQPYALMFWPDGNVKDIITNMSACPESNCLKDFEDRLNNNAIKVDALLRVSKREYFRLKSI